VVVVWVLVLLTGLVALILGAVRKIRDHQASLADVFLGGSLTVQATGEIVHLHDHISALVAVVLAFLAIATFFRDRRKTQPTNTHGR
jgi:hypothetical protein